VEREQGKGGEDRKRKGRQGRGREGRGKVAPPDVCPRAPDILATPLAVPLTTFVGGNLDRNSLISCLARSAF